MVRVLVFAAAPNPAVPGKREWAIASNKGTSTDDEEVSGRDEDASLTTTFGDGGDLDSGLKSEATASRSIEYTRSERVSWSISQSRLAASRTRSLLPTQTLDTISIEEDTMLSGNSSIGAYPLYTFSVRLLTPLSTVIQLAQGRKPASVKVSIVVAVLDTQGPDSVAIQRGASAGTRVSRLQLTLGDEENAVISLTAWRETADRWGNLTETIGLKRGDVVHLENVSAQVKEDDVVMLTASPYLNSKMTICYRTLPYPHEDRTLRPDLRLGQSDTAVLKVSAVVDWYQKTMANSS